MLQNPKFWVFTMNRLAAEGDPPSGMNWVAQFSLVIDVSVNAMGINIELNNLFAIENVSKRVEEVGSGVDETQVRNKN
ncbi:hypothetical protein DEO72_LG2g3203 [Vigna unguiculata]|uniref:Uncharacterized protein n=1 Tax=Vigna unguiculata TaxID=3917 RepID=A0A4D6L2X0_VIGUN|nr:hypothetical protein DEO72_LG2g3203 [Vigna unguiculata]